MCVWSVVSGLEQLYFTCNCWSFNSLSPFGFGSFCCHAGTGSWAGWCTVSCCFLAGRSKPSSTKIYSIYLSEKQTKVPSSALCAIAATLARGSRALAWPWHWCWHPLSDQGPLALMPVAPRVTRDRDDAASQRTEQCSAIDFLSCSMWTIIFMLQATSCSNFQNNWIPKGGETIIRVLNTDLVSSQSKIPILQGK